MGTTFLPFTAEISLLSSAIALSNLVILGTGTQSVTADRDTRHSNYLNKYKGVRQQSIIKY